VAEMALPPERERFMNGLEIIFFGFIATIVVASIVWMLWLSRDLER
jgi:heme/copper-type cytochrome/quinol oxidase subunit 4